MLNITGFYASLLALLIVCLGLRVVVLRRKFRVGVLDGGNPQLLKAMRAHGNAIEWVPIVLILLACAESQHMASWELHTLGLTLLIARLFHAHGLSRTRGISLGRFLGVVGTIVVTAVLIVYNCTSFALPLLSV